MQQSNLTVLGCGDAFSSGGRYHTSFLIEDETSAMLLDCGATTLVRLKQLKVDLRKLQIIIVTHFHGDHYGGLPFIFLSLRFEMSRKDRLTIVGPAGLREKVYALQEAMYPDTSFVIDELPIQFVEFGDQWQDVGPCELRALPVNHAPGSHPHGVQLRWRGKVMAFSGDTEWDDNLVELAAGTDLMICECNLCDEPAPGHLDYSTLSEKAPLLNTKRLLLSHLGPRMLAKETLFDKLQDGQRLSLW